MATRKKTGPKVSTVPTGRRKSRRNSSHLRLIEPTRPPEWLPDWKDPSAYPDPKKTTDLQWAWEFLRRNKQYQADWHVEWLAHFKTQGKPLGEIIPTDDQGSRGRKYYFSTYGLYTLPDPSIARPQHLVFEPGFGEIRMYGMKKLDGEPGSEAIWVYEKKSHGSIKIILTRDQAVVSFNVTLPLQSQLKKAREHLKRVQSIRQITPKLKRPRRDLFQSYLRMLDATGVARSHGKLPASCMATWPSLISESGQRSRRRNESETLNFGSSPSGGYPISS